MKKAAIVLMLLAFAALAEEPLTNDDVIKLVGAGLTQDTIETKIFNSATNFRTDADALIDLTRVGVPDRVIRAMIARQAEQSNPGAQSAPPTMPPEPVTAKPKIPARYYEVAIHRTKTARCDSGELKLDAAGAHGRGCRPTDFDVYWTEMTSVCYQYGSRGVVEFRTAKRKWRISTPTTSEARRIMGTVAEARPSLRRSEGCP